MFKVWINTAKKSITAIVVAQTQTEAAGLLNNELRRTGEKPDVEIEHMKHLTTGYSHVIILKDGDKK